MTAGGRQAGAKAGLGVGVAFDIVAGILWLLATPRVSDVGMALVIGLATAIAGLTSGWLLGKAAFAARGRLAGAGVVVGVAFFATVVGDLVLSFALGVGTAVANGGDPVTILASALAMTIAFAGLGLLFVGPFVSPITGLAAVIWASIMARLSRRARGTAG